MRKDYVLIAEVLRAVRPNTADEAMHVQWVYDTRALADALGRDNPRFDRDRFLKAAGVQS